MDQLHSDYHLIWFSQPKEAQNYDNQLGGGDSRPPSHPTESSQSKPSRSNSPTPRGLPNIISRDNQHTIRNTQQSTGRGGGWAKHQHQQQAMATAAIGSEGCGNIEATGSDCQQSLFAKRREPDI